jgi:PilZ domain
LYPVTSSQSESCPDERRRNPRHRAPSIIYVQLGSENGGVVVNLGVDGLAFQAAMKLTAERNSILNLRLRGSGLNVEFAGELVWLGGTQKEVGICFKNLSTNVRQDIADWIAREARLYETAALDDWSRPKPMPAMPGIPATGEESVPHSFSAALAKFRAISVDPLSSADADANESCLPASLNSATGMSGAPPLLKIVSPIRDCNVSADELDDHPQGRYADSLASAEECQVEQPLHDQALFEPFPIELPYQFPAGYSSPIILSEEPIPPVREEIPKASAEPPGKSEFCKTEEIEPIPRDRVSQSPDGLLEGTAADRWIPPALLAAWKRGNRQHKLLLASTGAACLGIFALILTLAVAHIDSSLGRSAGSGSLQQPTALPAATSASVGTPQTGPIQAPPAPPAIVRPRSHRPPVSLLAKISNNLFGHEPEAIPGITNEQIGVQVWTSQSSGYYYCTDSAFNKTGQPGTFMAQGDALQSGYRPKLGQFCD